MNHDPGTWDMFADIEAVSAWMEERGIFTPVTPGPAHDVEKLAQVAVTSLAAIQRVTQSPAVTRGIVASTIAMILKISEMRPGTLHDGTGARCWCGESHTVSASLALNLGQTHHGKRL